MARRLLCSFRHVRFLAHAAQKLSLLSQQLAVVDAAVAHTVLGGQLCDDVCQRRIVAMAPSREKVMSQMKVQAADNMVQPAWLGLPVTGRCEIMSIPAVGH